VPAPDAAPDAEEGGDAAVGEPVGLVLVVGGDQVERAVAVHVGERGRDGRLSGREEASAADEPAGSPVDEDVHAVVSVVVRERQHEIRPPVAGHVAGRQERKVVGVALVDDPAPAESARGERARDVGPRRADRDARILGAAVGVVAAVGVRDEVGQAVAVEVRGGV
jgi:hypothetical protein